MDELILPLLLSASAGVLAGVALILMKLRLGHRAATSTAAPGGDDTITSANPHSSATKIETPIGARLRPESRGYSPSLGLMEEVTMALRQVPPFPQAMLQVLREIEAAGSSAQTVAQIAGREPVVAAGLLRIANSAALGLRREIVTVADAVAYLGFSTTKALLLRMKVGALFPPVAPPGCYDTQKLWVHSMAVAQAADELARRAGGVDPDLALTAGLLHDIGKFAINSHFPDKVRELWPPAQTPLSAAAATESFLARERRLFGADHAMIGGHLAAEWKLPAELVDMIRLHHAPLEQDPAMPPEARRALYCVFVADQLVKYRHLYCRDMEIDPIPEQVAQELHISANPQALLDQRLADMIDRVIALNAGIDAGPKNAAA